jgi:sugar/nucleoside kinase (ribokinase family)
MSVLVIGTVALDDVETPADRRDDVVGGSATFFSHAAAGFGPVRLVAIVGEDFPAEQVTALEERGVDTTGLLRTPGKSFHWAGRYLGDMNTRETLSTELNVFGDWQPEVPAAYRETPFVFLANGHPAIQAAALDQMTAPRFVLLDTMNLWIDTARDDLDAVLRRVDAVTVNDEEARMLTGEQNLVRAARAMLDLGPGVVIVKKAEHGSFLVTRDDFAAVPAYPVTSLVDPTGAGDSFAGGFLGSLATGEEVTARRLRESMFHGTVQASFAVESFSVERLAALEDSEREARFAELVAMTGLG